MGFYDLEVLMVLRDYIQGFHGIEFKIDKAKFDTAIFINEYGKLVIPEPNTDAAALKKQGFKEFVPDLWNYNLMAAIEYQEEPKPMKGPKIIKKGHTEFSDEEKDLYYKIAGIRQLKIWESNPNWMETIDSFICKITNMPKC